MKKILLSAIIIALLVVQASAQVTERLPVRRSANIALKRISSTLTEEWVKTSSTFKNVSKTEFVYGTNSQSSTTSTYETATSSWVNSTKIETTFDINLNPTLQINYSWDKAGSQWKYSSKEEAVYNGSGNMTSSIYYLWNTITSQWSGYNKSEYTYDLSGNILTDTQYDYNIVTSTWENTFKTEYAWTGGVNTHDITYEWNAVLPVPAWENSSKSIYTYNTEGKISIEVSQAWDKTLSTPDWVNSDKTEYSYDASGRITSYIDYVWDTELATPAWVGSSKTEINYDAQGNIIQDVTYLWDVTESKWVGFMKLESTINPLSTVSLIYTWDIPSTDWSLNSRTTTFYTDPTRADYNTIKGIKIYPNPSRGDVTFDLGDSFTDMDISIYNINGKRIMHLKNQGNISKLPSGTLEKGLYIYRINNGKNTTSGKLVIE